MPLRKPLFIFFGWLTRLIRMAPRLGAAVALSASLLAHAGSSLLESPSSAVVQTPEVRAELVAYAPQGITKGAPLELGLLLQHQEGWHTYWKNPGDSGLATELHWTLPEGLQAGPIQWPTPRKIAIGKLANFGYEGQVLLPVRVSMERNFRPPTGSSDIAVHLNASWLVCKTECIPQEGQFDLRIPVQGSTAVGAPWFEAASKTLPKPLTGVLEARLEGNTLVLRSQALPGAWQGKAISVFPEAVEIFTTAASASQTDKVVPDHPPTAATQSWQGAAWSAQLPLSAQRTERPSKIAFLLALNDQSVQGTATVSGVWPDKATSREAAAQPEPSVNTPTTADAGALWWALAAAFVGGLILNLMPCVFPILAIKALGFTTTSTQSHVPRWWIGAAYTLGVVLSMLALGVLLLLLRTGGEQLGWGFQLQSPAVVAGLAVLFTLMGLNLLGLLEWGNLVPGALAGVQLRHPALDAALSGVLAVAVASPCTAPFMGASLGLALTLPAWQAVGIFVALGLGLAAPFALLSSVPQLAGWLPKPGVWMLHLRQFMAFPMVATVLWLLWVLGHLSGIDAAASLAALLWSLALTAWGLNLKGHSRWVFASLGAVITLVLLRMVGPNVLQTLALGPSSQQFSNSVVVADTWEPWSSMRVDAELREGRPVFVDFTAAWCITCQYNKQTTLSKAEVLQDFARKHVTLMRADWTRRDPEITRALSALGRSGVPVYVLYQAGKAPVVLSEILSESAVRAALSTL